MNATKDVILFIISLFVITSIALYGLSEAFKIVNENDAELRKNTPQTRYENEVLEHGRVNVLIGSDFYRIIYLDRSGAMIKKDFKFDGDLHMVQSNKTKLVIENPECCLYPTVYTLHGDFNIT